MIQKKDVKVYLKAMFRGRDYLKKWISACEKIGLDYVFLLKGQEYQWNYNKLKGNPVDVLNWDFPNKLQSEIQLIIATSLLHPICKGVGAAHCLPFWHNDRKYTINIDADDSIHDGDLGNLLLSALDMLNKSKTPVLSYDVHFSISDDKMTGVTSAWPHIWCFGLCVSETEFMKNSISKVLTTPWHAECVWKGFINLDLALDRYFQYNFDFPISFITKTGKYIHRPPCPPAPHGPLYHFYDPIKDFVIKDYRNWKNLPEEFHYREITRHPRTKLIDI